MTDPIRTKTMEEFQEEFRKRLYAASIAGLFALVAAIGGAVWTYIRTLPGPLGLVPNGAVVAFWSEPEAKHADVCPDGWNPVSETAGRIIIGAGQQKEVWQRYTDGSSVPNGERMPFTPRKPQDVGGEETHVLTEKEMPGHIHGFEGTPQKRSGQGNWALDFAVGGPIGDTPVPDYTPSGKITSAGGGLSHNTLPPFLALYFCKKS
jgi:hypothetical protein